MGLSLCTLACGKFTEDDLKPHGACNLSPAELRKLRKAILGGKLAPCFVGKDIQQSPVKLEECPICFMGYPILNTSLCCGKRLCTECYLQVQESAVPVGVSTCPFCKVKPYVVRLMGPKSEEEVRREQEEERRMAQAKRKARQVELLKEQRQQYMRLYGGASGPNSHVPERQGTDDDELPELADIPLELLQHMAAREDSHGRRLVGQGNMSDTPGATLEARLGLAGLTVAPLDRQNSEAERNLGRVFDRTQSELSEATAVGRPPLDRSRSGTREARAFEGGHHAAADSRAHIRRTFSGSSRETQAWEEGDAAAQVLSRSFSMDRGRSREGQQAGVGTGRPPYVMVGMSSLLQEGVVDPSTPAAVSRRNHQPASPTTQSSADNFTIPQLPREFLEKYVPPDLVEAITSLDQLDRLLLELAMIDSLKAGKQLPEMAPDSEKGPDRVGVDNPLRAPTPSTSTKTPPAPAPPPLQVPMSREATPKSERVTVGDEGELHHNYNDYLIHDSAEEEDRSSTTGRHRQRVASVLGKPPNVPLATPPSRSAAGDPTTKGTTPTRSASPKVVRKQEPFVPFRRSNSGRIVLADEDDSPGPDRYVKEQPELDVLSDASGASVGFLSPSYRKATGAASTPRPSTTDKLLDRQLNPTKQPVPGGDETVGGADRGGTVAAAVQGQREDKPRPGLHRGAVSKFQDIDTRRTPLMADPTGSATAVANARVHQGEERLKSRSVKEESQGGPSPVHPRVGTTEQIPEWNETTRVSKSPSNIHHSAPLFLGRDSPHLVSPGRPSSENGSLPVKRPSADIELDVVWRQAPMQRLEKRVRLSSETEEVSEQPQIGRDLDTIARSIFVDVPASKGLPLPQRPRSANGSLESLSRSYSDLSADIQRVKMLIRSSSGNLKNEWLTEVGEEQPQVGSSELCSAGTSARQEGPTRSTGYEEPMRKGSTGEAVSAVKSGRPAVVEATGTRQVEVHHLGNISIKREEVGARSNGGVRGAPTEGDGQRLGGVPGEKMRLSSTAGSDVPTSENAQSTGPMTGNMVRKDPMPFMKHRGALIQKMHSEDIEGERPGSDGLNTPMGPTDRFGEAGGGPGPLVVNNTEDQGKGSGSRVAVGLPRMPDDPNLRVKVLNQGPGGRTILLGQPFNHRHSWSGPGDQVPQSMPLYELLGQLSSYGEREHPSRTTFMMVSIVHQIHQDDGGAEGSQNERRTSSNDHAGVDLLHACMSDQPVNQSGDVGNATRGPSGSGGHIMAHDGSTQDTPSDCQLPLWSGEQGHWGRTDRGSGMVVGSENNVILEHARADELLKLQLDEGDMEFTMKIALAQHCCGAIANGDGVEPSGLTRGLHAESDVVALPASMVVENPDGSLFVISPAMPPGVDTLPSSDKLHGGGHSELGEALPPQAPVATAGGAVHDDQDDDFKQQLDAADQAYYQRLLGNDPFLESQPLITPLRDDELAERLNVLDEQLRKGMEASRMV